MLGVATLTALRGVWFEGSQRNSEQKSRKSELEKKFEKQLARRRKPANFSARHGKRFESGKAVGLKRVWGEKPKVRRSRKGMRELG